MIKRLFQIFFKIRDVLVVRLYGNYALLAVFLIVTLQIPVFSAGFKFKGSVTSDLSLIQSVITDEKDDLDLAGVSSFSLNVKNKFSRYGKFVSSFDVIVPYGGSIQEYSYTNISDINLDSLLNNVEMFSFGEVPVLVDLRKFYISVYFPFADLTIGRQIINFGKGVFFSPSDVFSTVEISDINFRRRGSDIVNFQIPISDLSGIDLISEIPYSDDSYSTALKYFNTVKYFDISLLTIYKNAGEDSLKSSEILAGLTFKGDVEIGLYGEAIVHTLTDTKEAYFEGMIGADYSVDNKWFFNLEYLYKQNDWIYSNWGEHNIFGSVSYSIDDLMNISTSLVYDISNEITLGSIQYFYNILQNVNTIIYIQGIDSSAGSYLKYSARVEVKF